MVAKILYNPLMPIIADASYAQIQPFWSLLRTPCLWLDHPQAQANITAMAAYAKSKAMALRPHGKSHKSAELALSQIAAGAVGVCCATLREAELMAEAGITDILLTTPMVTPAAIAGLIALHQGGYNVRVVVDDARNVSAISTALAQHQGGRKNAPQQRVLPVLVDVDVGQRRCGVRGVEAGVTLASHIANSAGLIFDGIQAYYGQLQHYTPLAARQKALLAQGLEISALTLALKDAGLAPRLVTGSGTGTILSGLEAGILNEWQPGSYLFLDQSYMSAGLLTAGEDLPSQGGTAFLRPSLFVLTTVISERQASVADGELRAHVIVDAGVKALATDSGKAVPVAGSHPAYQQGWSYRFMGDEYGAICAEEGEELPKLGEQLLLHVPHCDPTVALHSAYYFLEAQGKKDDATQPWVSENWRLRRWPIIARGSW
jgi:3-hydroxy-D-aspartate aldolase